MMGSPVIINLVLFLCISFLIYLLPIKHKRGILIYVFSIQFFIFHAFKDPTTLPDLAEYIYHFENSGVYNFFEHMLFSRMEPGWLALNHLLYVISPNYKILLFFTSLLFVFLYMYTIHKYSVMPFLSILLFLLIIYSQSLFVLRQHLAVAVLFCAIPAILNRKIFQFLFVLTVASSIHMTAIVFFPAYFIYAFRINLKFWIIIISISFLMFFFFQSVVSGLTSGTYIGGYMEKEMTGTWTGSLIALVIILFALFFCRVNTFDGIEKLSFQMICICLCLEVGGAVSTFGMMGRLALFYNVYSILLFPFLLSHIRLKYRYVVSICILLCYAYIWYSYAIGEYVSSMELLF